MDTLSRSGTTAGSVEGLLVIMAKEPRPGEVKTRLQPRLSAHDAAELYRRLLLDRVEEMDALLPSPAVALAYSPSSAEPFFASLAPPSFLLFPQSEGSLSRRLIKAFTRCFAAGFPRVSIIDSDSPDLSADTIRRSFQLLAGGADVVFGPSTDGGYYLVGLNGLREELFHDIPWSTSKVLSASLERARARSLRTRLLEKLTDIDHIEDLAEFHRRRADCAESEDLPGARTFEFAAALHRDGRFDALRRAREVS